jgi:hypothetical protein
MVNSATGVWISVAECLGRFELFSSALSRDRRLRGLCVEVSEEIAEFEKAARREASPGCLSV